MPSIGHFNKIAEVLATNKRQSKGRAFTTRPRRSARRRQMGSNSKHETVAAESGRITLELPPKSLLESLGVDSSTLRSALLDYKYQAPKLSFLETLKPIRRVCLARPSEHASKRNQHHGECEHGDTHSSWI